MLHKSSRPVNNGLNDRSAGDGSNGGQRLHSPHLLYERAPVQITTAPNMNRECRVERGCPPFGHSRTDREQGAHVGPAPPAWDVWHHCVAAVVVP